MYRLTVDLKSGDPAVHRARHFVVSHEDVRDELFLHVTGYDEEDRRTIRLYTKWTDVRLVTIARESDLAEGAS